MKIAKKNYSQIVKKTVANHFDILSESYDEKSIKRENYLNAIDKLILDELTQGNDFNILDVACGTAFRTEKYKLNLNGSSVYGCDISANMLSQASNRLTDGLVLADMIDLSFREGVFDAISCLFNAVGYLSNPEERITTLRGFHKILKNNGLLFIDFMNRWHLGEGLFFRRSFLSALKIYIRSMFPSPSLKGNMFFDLPLDSKKVRGFVHGFSDREIESLLFNAQFSIVRKFIIGYDSGELKNKKTQGQFFYIARKINNIN